MKFVNKFHSNSILPFSICRIKSGSVIQTKHFDIKMSLEIRQAKSFFLTLWVMFFASFHFFIFFILRITINCNYLFTKHFKYKTLISICQRPPPPEKFVVFYLYKRWVGKGGYVVMLRKAVGLAQGGFGGIALNTKRLCSLGIFVVCRSICMAGIVAIADAF